MTTASREPTAGIIIRRLIWVLFGVGLFAALVLFGNRWQQFLPRSTTHAEITTVVSRATLPILITAGGELESAVKTDVFSEVEGQQIKIVEMLPEGTQVTPGTIVMALDPSDVKRQLTEQEIRVMKAESLVKTAQQEVTIQLNLFATSLAKAELAKTLADLDQKKYLNGDHKIALKDLQGQLALAETGLQEARLMVEAYEKLVKKGFRTPEQMRAKEQDLDRAQFVVSRDTEKLKVLEDFTFERQRVELAAKAEETERELERLKISAAAAGNKAKTDLAAAEATARWERSQLEKFKKQLENCQVRAPREGIVVYAKQEGKRVELGATVHFKQQLFSLPDMTQLQVKAFVHESALRRIAPGQKAQVRIDAFPDVVLEGTVDRIDSFYDSVRHWMSGGVKEYTAVVKIDSVPSKISAKPGMTASAQIVAGKLSEALVVPIPAVTEQDGQYICYILANETMERREVILGDNTDTHVEVISGLREGEQVALNARARAMAEIRTPPTKPATDSDKHLVAATPKL